MRFKVAECGSKSQASCCLGEMGGNFPRPISEDAPREVRRPRPMGRFVFILGSAPARRLLQSGHMRTQRAGCSAPCRRRAGCAGRARTSAQRSSSRKSRSTCQLYLAEHSR